MRISKDELAAQQLGEYEGRMTDFGDWRVAFERMPAHFPPDESPFKGLPDDRCQCLHLGVVTKGSFEVTYLDDSRELVRAGEAYSLAPGHFVQTLEPTEVVEFSPRAEHDRTMETVARNLAAVSA
jgi:DNA-binding transcriptional LysR family regulator